MKNLVAVFLFAALLLCSSCEKTILGTEDAPALPTQHSTRFGTILDSLRYALDLPALAGAIVTETSIIECDAVGYRRYGGTIGVTVNDQFHLGSNTKAFTAVLLGMLVDEGRLRWTSTLPELFPELTETMRPEYRSVTLQNILSHSAGFMREPTVAPHAGTPKEQRAEIAAWALMQPPARARGTYLYSNLGFNIAGTIAERIAGKPYEELLVERVLTPLGITTAGFGPMGTPGAEDEPLQHTNGHSPIEPSLAGDIPVTSTPAGRLHMSIGDWAKFIQWVLAAEHGHQALLADATARMLTSSLVAADGEGYYGMGWGIIERSWARGRVLTHSGSNIFNYSEAVVAPNIGVGFIVATNQGPGTAANPLDPAATRLINFYLDGR
jgi:CubicO group peptidase (beta-lactamase class C family)